MEISGMLLLLGSAICWHPQLVGLDDREAKIVKLIEALYGEVDYEDEVRSKKVIQVLFLKRNSALKDQDLIILNDLVDLQSLFINNNNITGKGFAALGSFDKLYMLELAKTSVDDDAMKWVAKNKNLKKLGLAHTKITDDGLKYLSRLSKVEFMDLSDTSVTESGLIHLKNMKNLRRLVIPEMKGDKGGLKALKEALPNLEIE